MRQLYIYILLIPFSIFPQSIVLELDTNTLRIGEQFNATIKCYNLDEDVVIWEEVDSIFKNFELMKKSNLKTDISGDTYIYKNFVLTTFDTGRFSIPSHPLSIVDGDTVFNNSLTVKFLQTPLDTTNRFFDIKPPKKISFLAKELLYYIPYILLIFLLIIVIWAWYYYSTKKKKIINVPIMNKAIDLYFLEQLDLLDRKKYLEDQKYKLFYTELSEIFRGYLENRFHIPALESGTFDLKILLHDIGVEEKWFNIFFRNCDIVKFAKGIPSNKESLLFLNQVRVFIETYSIEEKKEHPINMDSNIMNSN